MNFDITKYVNYLLVSGSHSYGMNTTTSDFDVRGFCIPPKEYFTSFHLKFEQHESKYQHVDFPWAIYLNAYCGSDQKRQCSLNEKIDCVIYGIHKFIKLAVDCNPSIIEYLFVDPEEILICDSFAQKLIDNRSLFLSTRAKYSFTGYAISQLKRINTHRKWILNPPSKKPERKDYGLPEKSLISSDQRSAADALLIKQVRLWTLEEAEVPKHLVDLIQEDLSYLIANITACKEDEVQNKIEAVAAKEVGIDENFLHVLQKEKAYRNALNHYNQYENWKATRNPQRSDLERQFGFDSKHASHLCRLILEAKDILYNGTLIVKNKERAQFLLSIRAGSMNYDQLMQWVDANMAELDERYKEKQLAVPSKPDVNKIDALVQELVEESWQRT